MPNTIYYTFEREATAGTAVKPLPYLAVVKERPRKPGLWSRIIQVFQRKPRRARSDKELFNEYLLEDDMIARNREVWNVGPVD